MSEIKPAARTYNQNHFWQIHAGARPSEYLLDLELPVGIAARSRGNGKPFLDYPFTAAGNTEFNCLLWLPPDNGRAGDIVMVDSTNFTTLFGGTESLKNFWKNIATVH